MTLWAATSTGRIFVSKNANAANPATVVLDRIDDEAANDAAALPDGDLHRSADANHAWITYSGFNAKTPGTPGHVFEVRYVPGASTFTILDGAGDGAFGDIPATSIAVANGTIVVGTDYGAVTSSGNGRLGGGRKGPAPRRRLRPRLRALAGSDLRGHARPGHLDAPAAVSQPGTNR